mmetsp:Transcript_14916/g.26423  ORF Transcript_14916/g.26423 Transcript_14916/m.26423 type:complete len:207 (-) Transcript_14916:1042-1662(-)
MRGDRPPIGHHLVALRNRVLDDGAGGGAAHLHHIRAAHALRRGRQRVHWHGGRERPARKGGPHDVCAPRLVGQRHLDHGVQSAGAHDGGVQHLGPVGGAQHKHVSCRLDSVDLGENLVQDARAHGVGAAVGASSRQRVDLVEKHDARLRLSSGLKERANARLAAAQPLVQQLRPADADKVGAATGGHGLGEHRFAASRRAVEQRAA